MTFNRALFSSASGDWETPQEPFDALNEEFHFNLDACATKENAKCGRYFCHYSLDLPWRSSVFCNPPYGREIGKWVCKGYAEAVRGTADVVVMLLDFLARARHVAQSIAEREGEVTADDVREVLSIPIDIHPSVMGSLFRGPQWKRIGWRKSSQPQRHANRVGVWRLR